MNDKIIKKVKFQAEFESAKEFDKWLKDQEKHLDMSLDNAFNKNVRAYQAKMKAVYKALEEAGDNPSESMMASMHKTIKEMVPLSKQLSTQFSKLKLGKELTEELEKANQEYVSLQNKIKATERLQKRMQNTKTTEGAKLNKEELTNVYNNVIAKSDKGLKVGKKTYGAGGLGVEQFIEDFKKDSEAFYKAKGEFEAVAQQLQTEVNAKIQSKLEAYTQRLKEQTDKLVAAKKALDDAQKRAGDAGRGKQAEAAVAGNTAALNLGAAVADTEKNSNAPSGSPTKAATEEVKDFNKENKKTPGIVKKAATQVLTYGTIVGLFKRGLSEAKRTIIELDKALTDMAIVTNLSREQAWKMVDSLQAIAKKTGTTTTAVASTVTKFLQQGKSMSQATQMAEVALKAASIAGIDAARSVDLLTNAMNGFQMSASQALEVSDKFAALAAASATDYEELAVALSKVAAQANLAGMSMDFTLGMLAKGIEVTREAPETIGTALKTVISRMRELSDYGETLEEGMDVNRVETALQNVGVQLRDTNGQFRNLEDVLTELGGKWNTLNVNQQANVAVALAGTRQQSRLIAMMQDFDRTLELVDISTNSYGATMAQQMEYAGGLEASMNGLTTAYEGLITNLTSSEVIITLVNMLAGVVEFIGEALDKTYIMVPLVALLALSGANILAQKIAENRYAKAKAKLDRAELINTNKKRLAEIQIRKEQLKTYINSLKERDVKEDTLENVLRQAKTQAEANGNTALAAKYAAEINELNADDAQEKITLIDAQKEYNTLTAEEGALHAQNVSLQGQQYGLLGNLTSGFASLAINLSYGVIQMGQMLVSQWAMIKAKKAEAAARKQNVAAIGAETAANTANAGASMAGSAGKIPYVGWIIGAIILAAVLGLAIIGIASYMSAAHDKEKDNVKSIEGNIKAVQKLQAEIYNLGQQTKTITALSDEFGTLSSKINKTADDVARLEEIIQEFNDSVGFEFITEGMDTDYVNMLMDGYKAILNIALDSKITEVNETLAKAIKNAQDLTEYLNNSEGKAVIKQALSQTSSSFGASTDMTQSVIMETIANNPDLFVASNGGLDFAQIEKIFTDELIAKIDTAVKNNSLQGFYDILNDPTLTNQQKEFLKNSTSMFKEVSGLNEEAVAAIDQLGLSAEQLEKISPMLKHLANEIKRNPNMTKGDVISALYTMLNSNYDTDELQQEIDALKTNKEDYLNTGLESYNRWDITSGYDTLKTIADLSKETGIDFDDLREMAMTKYFEYSVEGKLTNYRDLVTLLYERSSQDDFTDTEKQLLAYFTQKLGGWQTDIDTKESFLEALEGGVTGIFNSYGNIKTVKDIQNAITTAQSTLDQLYKAASGELSTEELDELLDKYPQLIDYMSDGVITATELNEARKAIFEQTQKEIQGNLDLVESQAELLFQQYGIDWNTYKDASFEDVSNVINTNIADEDKQNEVLNAWRQYIQNRDKLINFEKTGLLSTEGAERIGKSTAISLAKATMQHYAEQLELYSTKDPEYKNILSSILSSAAQMVAAGHGAKTKAAKAIDDALGGHRWTIYGDELFYVDASGTAIALSEIEDEAIKADFERITENMITAYSEAHDTILAGAQEFANRYKESKEKELEDEIAIIDKKKEAYQEYFEEVDALEEEQERTQSKEDIIRQLSALSSGVNGTTKSKIKELQSQLDDLLKEEQEAAKEAARNELLEDLDDQTEELNKSMEGLDDSIGVLIRALINAAGIDLSKFEYDSTSGKSMSQQIEEFLHAMGVPGYSKGGLVDYTGLAMVHGSAAHPEAFLSAEDTDLLSNLLGMLHLVSDEINSGGGDNTNISNHNNNSITIENINIKTEQLNNTQDFKTAGSTLAQEFAAIIRERGLNVNVKK